MAAIFQAVFCAAIFFMIGLRYRPLPDTRYKFAMSLMAWAACSITGMQCISLVAPIVLHGVYPNASWFNSAFYFLAAVLVWRARGNVARIMKVD